MANIKYQQRSLLLLLPLGLLAVASYALDKRIPIGISPKLQSQLLDLMRIIIPGFFAVAVAFLLPTIKRSLQITAVIVNYIALAWFSHVRYGDFFTQPTAWILSSLVTTLILLPSNDSDGESEGLSFKNLIIKTIGVMIMPALTMLTIVVVIKNIEHSILITFTSVFIDSFLSCLFVPIYEVMLTLGFSSLLNSLVSLQNESVTIHAMLNSIMLVNMISLPAIILTRALFSKNYSCLFVFFLALIVFLTSKIGTCISVELMILLLMYPGSYLTLCLSSIIIFFISVYMQLPSVTSFYMLYQPDLIIRNLTFLQLNSTYYELMILAALIPVTTQILLTRIGKINHLKNKLRHKYRNSGYNIKDIRNPDLLLISILNAIGGTSNLRKVFIKNEALHIVVFDYRKITPTQLNLVSGRRAEFIRAEDTIRLSLGSLSYIVYKRLSNIIEDSDGFVNNEIELFEQFNIKEYVENIQEKSKIERLRLDTDKT